MKKSQALFEYNLNRLGRYITAMSNLSAEYDIVTLLEQVALDAKRYPSRYIDHKWVTNEDSLYAKSR